MSYKGDSPGKKISRLRTWLALMRLSHIFHIPYQGSLVLAGEGGDLSTMEGLGFPAETITAVDLDEDWLDYSREVYPGVNTVHGEAGAMSKTVPYSLAHLDFCGGLSTANIRTVAQVVNNMNSHPAVIAVTMLKGREHLGSHTSEILQVDRIKRRAALKSCRKWTNPSAPIIRHILSNGVFNPRLVLQHAEDGMRGAFKPSSEMGNYLYKKNGKLSALGSAVLRSLGLMACVEATLMAWNVQFGGERLCLCYAGTFGYHSRSKKAHGTPFMTAFFLVQRESQLSAVVDLAMRNASNLLQHSLNIAESLEYLKPTAAQFTETMSVEAVAKMFDVPVRTIIAWKAHATRGTYKLPPLLRILPREDPESKSDAKFFGLGAPTLGLPF